MDMGLFHKRSKTTKEEKSALSAVVESGSLMHAISNLLLQSLLITRDTKLHADLFADLAGGSPSELRRSYIQFQASFRKMPRALEMTKQAIKEMKAARKPVKVVEAYTKQVVADLAEQHISQKDKENVEEHDIYAVSKNAESAVQLNIQRCETIRDRIKELMDENKTLPAHSDANLPAFLTSMSRQLSELASWQEAAFNAFHHLNTVMQRVASMEQDALMEDMKRTADERNAHLNELLKRLSV